MNKCASEKRAAVNPLLDGVKCQARRPLRTPRHDIRFTRSGRECLCIVWPLWADIGFRPHRRVLETFAALIRANRSAGRDIVPEFAL